MMNKGHLASRSSQPNGGANPSGDKCDTIAVITQTKFCGTIEKKTIVAVHGVQEGQEELLHVQGQEGQP